MYNLATDKQSTQSSIEMNDRIVSKITQIIRINVNNNKPLLPCFLINNKSEQSQIMKEPVIHC